MDQERGLEGRLSKQVPHLFFIVWQSHKGELSAVRSSEQQIDMPLLKHCYASTFIDSK